MVASPGSWAEPAHVEMLTKLWDEGCSASQISLAFRKIGATYSRSAVLGKVHRMARGRFRANGEAMSTRRRPSKPGAPKVRKVSIRTEARVFGETKVPIIKGTKPPFVPAPPEPVGDNACGLMDLRYGVCRWPLNEPQRGDMADTLFCGEATAEDNPYCAHHRIKSVRPPEHQPKGGDKALARSLRWATA